MLMPAMYSCVHILAEAVAGLPVHLYKYTVSGKEKGIVYRLQTRQQLFLLRHSRAGESFRFPHPGTFPRKNIYNIAESGKTFFTLAVHIVQYDI